MGNEEREKERGRKKKDWKRERCVALDEVSSMTKGMASILQAVLHLRLQ